jgi:hypothetical protein
VPDGAGSPAALLAIVAAGAGGAGRDTAGPARRSGWAIASVIGCAEEAGERGDGLKQQRVDAGLLVGGAAGAELGDRLAVLGLGGKLAHPGGEGGTDGRRRCRPTIG